MPTEPVRDSEVSTRSVVLGQSPDGDMYVLSTTGDQQDDPILEPAKVMRIGRMISRLLEELGDTQLDEASRTRLREIYVRSIKELAECLSPVLRRELRRITTSFNKTDAPTESELRVAQAQLVGWLEGLFQGMQTAIVAQHLSANKPDQSARNAASILALAASAQNNGSGQYL